MSPSETLGTNLRMVRGDPQLYHRLIAAETRSLDLTYAAISPENMEAFVSALGTPRRYGPGCNPRSAAGSGSSVAAETRSLDLTYAAISPEIM